MLGLVVSTRRRYQIIESESLCMSPGCRSHRHSSQLFNIWYYPLQPKKEGL